MQVKTFNAAAGVVVQEGLQEPDGRVQVGLGFDGESGTVTDWFESISKQRVVVALGFPEINLVVPPNDEFVDHGPFHVVDGQNGDRTCALCQSGRG